MALIDTLIHFAVLKTSYFFSLKHMAVQYLPAMALTWLQGSTLYVQPTMGRENIDLSALQVLSTHP